MTKPTLALQVYSVRDVYLEDKAATLEKIAKAGYDAVELCFDRDTPANEMRAALESSGLTVAGYHTGWDALDDEHFDSTVEYNRAIGNRYIIVPGLPESMICSTDAWKRTCELFTVMNEKLKKEGMRFGYYSNGADHKCFEDGNYGWKLFGEGTPNDVVMQIDTGNCMAAGFDPLKEYARWAHRGATVHFKPYSKAEGYKPVIGRDDIDWDKAVWIAKSCGVCEYIIVEYECLGGFEGVTACAAELRKRI